MGGSPQIGAKDLIWSLIHLSRPSKEGKAVRVSNTSQIGISWFRREGVLNKTTLGKRNLSRERSWFQPIITTGNENVSANRRHEAQIRQG
jgi:hypothetical protein